MLFGPGPNPLDGLHIRVGGNLYTPQKTNFGPAVGFAWSPNRWQNKVVVRGGFGINYNQNEIAITANASGNPPNASKPFFHCDFPYTTNPSCSGTGILYETAGDLNSIFGYAPNPAAIYNVYAGKSSCIAGTRCSRDSRAIRRQSRIITTPSMCKIKLTSKPDLHFGISGKSDSAPARAQQLECNRRGSRIRDESAREYGQLLGKHRKRELQCDGGHAQSQLLAQFPGDGDLHLGAFHG